MREAYALGAVDYLVKPIVPEILRAKVAVFVELFQKSAQLKRQADQLRASEADLIEFTRGRLAHLKCPTSIEFRDSLVRTATGKLQKFKLRSPYWEGRDRAVN